MRIVATILLMISMKMGVAQSKHFQFLGGYNLVATRGVYSRINGLEHGLRLNTHYYLSKKHMAPYLSLDLLGIRRIRNGTWISHGGYPDRITRNYRSYDILSDIGFGASVRSGPHKYFNVGLGLQGIGFSIIKGTMVVNEARVTSTAPDGNYYPYYEKTSYRYDNALEADIQDYVRFYAKVEYGFQSKFTQKYKLNYKLGLSTWNVYFLVGLSKNKKP